jgi:hypothetical protein
LKIWFDTEFIEDGKTIDLISIGLVREDGRQLYYENAECDLSRACLWVQENVIPHLCGPTPPWDTRGETNVLRKRAEIAREIVEFVGEKPEFWAYYGAYDWVALCQLYGRMVDLPAGWPKYVRDLKQLAGKRPLPPHTGVAHNALDDALWTKLAWESLQ